MANLNSRLPENVPGAFYVTSDCIDCDICRVDAPSTFKRNEESGYSMVFRQPETEAEREMAEEALTGCPVDAIGNNGAGG